MNAAIEKRLKEIIYGAPGSNERQEHLEELRSSLRKLEFEEQVRQLAGVDELPAGWKELVRAALNA